MNILVLSDTHGEIQKALEMVKRVSVGMKVDRIIHCGDYYKDALRLEEETGIPVTAVHGNCDGQQEREVSVLETPAGKIAITHGHTENVKWSLQNLCYLAEEYGCRCVCFGHTHVPVNETVSGIHLLNPGSLTNPRGGSRPSCGLLVATEKSLAATLMEYESTANIGK